MAPQKVLAGVPISLQDTCAGSLPPHSVLQAYLMLLCDCQGTLLAFGHMQH
jgi:hypothetical protein